MAEVVDVVSGETCADLVDISYPIYQAMGANLHGTPVVCGGSFSSTSTHYQECHKFTNGEWQEFAIMNEKRVAAAAIMHKNKFHVFGGMNGYSSQTSELIGIDGGVEYGPELPTALTLHAITSINSTVSILSGGSTYGNSWSPLTRYFNHETNSFLPGPDLLEGRRSHSSATCVDKVTKAKIPIVTGGWGNGDVTLNSTELLINEQWQPGTIQCKKATYFDLL